jgi:cysteine desulfurase/selenocysteine lyase
MPINEIVDLAKKRNIPVLVDGTQGAPHLQLDMQNLDCDFYAISCHKMYGPNGLGILYAKKKWLDALPPYQGGGGMISEVLKEKVSYASSPTKFEAGTMQTAEVVAFAEAIKFIENLGIKNIQSHENEILEYGIEKLKKSNSVNIIGDPKVRGSVISFTIKGIHPHDIATILDEDGVAIRAGHHCCQILHDKLGISASARASIGVYNSKDDIDFLSNGIDKCKKIFKA